MLFAVWGRETEEMEIRVFKQASAWIVHIQHSYSQTESPQKTRVDIRKINELQ